jgi:hypothetical protein
MSEDSREKLAGSPFTKMSEWKEARARCVDEIWQDLMPMLAMDEEILQNPAVEQYVQKYWKTPWSGGPESNPEHDANGLITYFISDKGVPSFRVSSKLLDAYRDQNVIEGLVRAGFSVFTDKWMTFMRMQGRRFTPPATLTIVENKKSEPVKKVRKSKKRK